MIQTNQSDTEIRMKYERSFTRWKEMPIATIPTPNGMPPTDTLPVIPPHIADSVDISTCNSAVIALLAPACVTQQGKEIPFPLLLATCHHMLATPSHLCHVSRYPEH